MKEYEAAFQNQPVDVSEEFTKQQNHFFVGSVVRGFDPNTASGEILWRGLALKQRVSYHQLTLQFEDYKVWEDTPPEEYEDEQSLPFSLSFVTSRRCASESPPAIVGSTTNPPSCCSAPPFRLSAYGKPPVDDAVIDLSHPEAVSWYQEKLAKLLRMGVGTFTADFGEAAPLTGIYHEKASSLLEHNLYPLRYNKAVADITKEITGNGAIYARSAWAGSQRYPIHWGGDAEITDGAMAGTLRGGLSLGLCGFSFWSHFIGGFSQKSPENLYLRWLAFGALTSHSRCHGTPNRGSTAKGSPKSFGAS